MLFNFNPVPKLIKISYSQTELHTQWSEGEEENEVLFSAVDFLLKIS